MSLNFFQNGGKLITYVQIMDTFCEVILRLLFILC